MVIAESYESVRSLCARYLTRFGFHVEQASNGVEALQSIRQSLPHVVLAEPRLPLLSAEGLAHSLAQDAGTRTIPIILMAASPHVADDAAPFQPAAVLQKPFLFTRMLDEVRRVLRARLTSL